MYYLDHCGSTHLSAEVKAKLEGLIRADIYGNPTAIHHEAGRDARDLIESTRHDVARELGAPASAVIFTSGATEANNLILWGFALRNHGRPCRIIFGATEHKSVFDTCQFLGAQGLAMVTELKVNGIGSIDLNDLEDELKKSVNIPTLVALMHINNEIAARSPIEDISELCRRYGAFYHCDGVQGFVRETIDLSEQIFGSYVLSPHKIYGPKGVGILLLGDGPISPRIVPALQGGDQEGGRRPGTHNTLAIAGAGVAVSQHNTQRTSRVKHMQKCEEAFVTTLTAMSTRVRLTVPCNRLAPGIVNFYFENIDAPTLLEHLPHVCINRGASCIGVSGERYSHVPKALGLPIEIQANVLRASFGDGVSLEESKVAAKLIVEAGELVKNPR